MQQAPCYCTGCRAPIKKCLHENISGSEATIDVVMKRASQDSLFVTCLEATKVKVKKPKAAAAGTSAATAGGSAVAAVGSAVAAVGGSDVAEVEQIVDLWKPREVVEVFTEDGQLHFYGPQTCLLTRVRVHQTVVVKLGANPGDGLGIGLLKSEVGGLTVTILLRKGKQVVEEEVIVQLKDVVMVSSVKPQSNAKGVKAMDEKEYASLLKIIYK
jgi:hypothetical protein